MPASTDPLRLCMVVGSVSYQAGGLFNSVRHLSQGISLAGADTTVIAPEDAFTETDLPHWAPLEPLCPPRYGPARLGFAPGLGRALRRVAPDVLHQHGIWQAFSAQVLAWRRRTRRPVMISPRGMLDPWALRQASGRKRAALALFEGANLRGAACLHALNEAEAAAFRAFGLTVPIAVIPNGTHLPPSDLPPPPRPAFLPADGRATLLFLGRLHPKKGVAELLQAFAAASSADPALAGRWRLVVAGWDDGGFAEPLPALARRLGLAEDRVLFPGPLLGADKTAMFAHADAFVLPSHSEGLPMAVLEAWAAGVPVLMSDACNLPEGFAEGAAVRIEVEPEALAVQLRGALARDLRTVAAAGRRLAETRFSWHSIAARHMEVYRYLRDGGPVPADLRLE